MTITEFHVCRQGRDLRWVVRLGDATAVYYGDYLDKEQALLDAIEAARDERGSGREARVWLREPTCADRIIF